MLRMHRITVVDFASNATGNHTNLTPYKGEQSGQNGHYKKEYAENTLTFLNYIKSHKLPFWNTKEKSNQNNTYI